MPADFAADADIVQAVEELLLSRPHVSAAARGAVVVNEVERDVPL